MSKDYYIVMRYDPIRIITNDIDYVGIITGKLKQATKESTLSRLLANMKKTEEETIKFQNKYEKWK